MPTTLLRVFVVVTLLVSCVRQNQGQQSSLTDVPIAITHATVIDATGAPAQRDMTVIVANRTITGVGKSSSVAIPEGAVTIDARGKFLIPGLWDMHVHEIFGDWIPEEEKITPALFVLNGVTGVRDMGGDLEPLKKWRSRIAAGELLGPRMVISGPMLDGPTPAFPSSAPIKDAADGRRVVEELKNAGADFIKIQSLVPPDGYFAAAAEAKKLGIAFAGHVPDQVRAVDASNAGQKSIEHLTGVFEACSTVEDELMAKPRGPGRGRFLSTHDPERARTLIALFVRNKTWQVPTLYWEQGEWLIEKTNQGADPLLKYAPTAWRERTWPMFTREISKSWSTDPIAEREAFFHAELKMIGEMNRAGVPILAGTDTAAGVRVYPGFSLHQELSLLVKAGLSPMQALQSATSNAAKFLELADSGTIERGKRADLVLLDADPLTNIANTHKISAVVLNGRYLNRSELDHLQVQIQEAAARSR
ncbi:MAG TPA: amidohydrolase family protein [Candidatus Eisenbacteria bacterium]|jgi:imidazolonepropionase-like amidohydrolase|nr:amidohydrolase family protein [Candidatus Eisenbacteria bacterium]